MTFDILLDYEAAFGAPPDEEMLKVFAGAAASGMSERMILVAVYHIQNEFERGHVNGAPGKAVAEYLRHLYRKGFR